MVAKPWEKQDNESPQSFEAFSTYRNMGPERSLSKLAKEIGKSAGLMARWSAKYDWQKRIEAWDRHLDTQTQEELVLERKQTARRHLMISAHLQEAVLERLIGSHRVAKLDLSKLTASDLVRMTALAKQIDDLTLGNPTERTEEVVTHRLDPLALQEALRKKREKLVDQALQEEHEEEKEINIVETHRLTAEEQVDLANYMTDQLRNGDDDA